MSPGGVIAVLRVVDICLIAVLGYGIFLAYHPWATLNTRYLAAISIGALIARVVFGWLGAYQDASETSVVVVFDGSSAQRHTEGGTEGEILVIYSEATVSAREAAAFVAAWKIRSPSELNASRTCS